MPLPRPRVLAAFDAEDLGFFKQHAQALAPIGLRDALRICLLVRDQDPERYQAAAVRWIGRFAVEAKDATLEELAYAVQIFQHLPCEPDDAMEQLAKLYARHRLK